MKQDRQRWEERYATEPEPGGRHSAEATPSAFLTAHAHLIHGRVLDVAAGAGRNTLFLARRGCAVEAFDIALGGLRRVLATARAEGLQVLAIQADLESFPLRPERYDAIINIRYLQRSLFPAFQRALKPGGTVLIETFLVDQQVFFGHPSNPAFLLQPGELRAAFSAWDVTHYDEGLLQTEGGQAYVARLIARRPWRRRLQGVD